MDAEGNSRTKPSNDVSSRSSHDDDESEILRLLLLVRLCSNVKKSTYSVETSSVLDRFMFGGLVIVMVVEEVGVWRKEGGIMVFVCWL